MTQEDRIKALCIAFTRKMKSQPMQGRLQLARAVRHAVIETRDTALKEVNDILRERISTLSREGDDAYLEVEKIREAVMMLVVDGEVKKHIIRP